MDNMNKLEITDVRLRAVKNKEKKLKAFVSITLNNAFVINGVKVLEGRKGLFVSMPSEKNREGVFRDIVHPINTEVRNMITNEVLDAYEATVGAEDADTEEKTEEKAETAEETTEAEA